MDALVTRWVIQSCLARIAITVSWDKCIYRPNKQTYCVNDKNKSMTNAQILVNLTSYSTKQWNETSLQLLLCILYNAKMAIFWQFLALAKTTPSRYITHITNCQPPLPSVCYKIWGRPQISIAIYRVSRYFFTIFIVDEILSIAHHYSYAIKRNNWPNLQAKFQDPETVGLN